MSKNTAQNGTENACCVYDFTSFDVENIPIRKMRDTLKEICKAYCFQIEKGEKTGKLHYQGRFSLKEKKRLSNLIQILKSYEWNNFHLSITSKENRNNDFYVSKRDTRIEGPFTDSNDVFIPDHVEEMKTLYPWQEKMKNILSTKDKRSIHIIFDPKGNKGKSCFTQYMMIYHESQILPFVNDYKDIMRMAYDVGTKKSYMIDMPRAICKEKLYSFYSGIETLKSGYCYDDRYKFQQRISNRPNICVFTNVEPDISLLSKDMWKIWTINKKLELVPYQILNNIDILDSSSDSSSESSNESSSEEKPKKKSKKFNKKK